jgi:hypothetical protein
MKMMAISLALLCLVPATVLAQSPELPNMDHEPHHHLTVQNDFVKIFDVRVSPGDSIILHSHDKDTVAIAIGEQLVTIGIPGKPDVHQKNADAQVRLQRSGYVHSTHVDGAAPYHTVAVELMHAQTGFHNVCAEILAGQPLNCTDDASQASSSKTVASVSQSLFESNETRVQLVRVLPGQKMIAGDGKEPQVLVAVDAVTLVADSGKGSAQKLKSGDFVWLAGGTAAREFRNTGKGEARYVRIAMKSM